MPVPLLKEVHWQVADELQRAVAVGIGVNIGVVVPLSVFDDFDSHMLTPGPRPAAPTIAPQVDGAIDGLLVRAVFKISGLTVRMRFTHLYPRRLIGITVVVQYPK